MGMMERPRLVLNKKAKSTHVYFHLSSSSHHSLRVFQAHGIRFKRDLEGGFTELGKDFNLSAITDKENKLVYKLMFDDR
jgi:hypothetical protein